MNGCRYTKPYCLGTWNCNVKGFSYQNPLDLSTMQDPLSTLICPYPPFYPTQTLFVPVDLNRTPFRVDVPKPKLTPT